MLCIPLADPVFYRCSRLIELEWILQSLLSLVYMENGHVQVLFLIEIKHVIDILLIRDSDEVFDVTCFIGGFDNTCHAIDMIGRKLKESPVTTVPRAQLLVQNLSLNINGQPREISLFNPNFYTP